MATELAIGYRVRTPQRRLPDARADRLADRPAIPQAVIDWPVGAGDPATDIAGPRAFKPTNAIHLQRPMAMPAALFEALVVAVMFVGVVTTLVFGIVAYVGEAESPRKVATVETRIVSFVPVAPSQHVAQRAAPQ